VTARRDGQKEKAAVQERPFRKNPMNSVESITESPMSPSPLVQLRIARRRLVLAWKESDYLLALTVLGAILLVLVVPMVVVFWRAVQ
jgi:Zn-dependent protease